MRLTVVGSGDAFGSGGRLQTSFHVGSRTGDFLIDCGATSNIGMQRLDIDPNGIERIFISHLHGDHFAGLIWWLLHAHYVGARTAPLTVYGPAGIAERFAAAAEALFPNSTQIARRFDLRFETFSPGVPIQLDGLKVTPFEVQHPSGATPYALRFEADGKVLSFSGDTRWVDNLIPAATGADLFISECFGYEPAAGYHMSWQGDVGRNIDRLGARRVLLTHMGPAMLARRDEVRHPKVMLAEDGMVLDI
jgi:ribonuclease BN (tRNA processing enzyme)